MSNFPPRAVPCLPTLLRCLCKPRPDELKEEIPHSPRLVLSLTTQMVHQVLAARVNGLFSLGVR